MLGTNASLPPWATGVDDLDEFARTHLLYEIHVLTAQGRKLAAEYAVKFDPVNRFVPPEVDALIEAGLVHLRLLDDFLGATRRQHKTDVLASDWPGNWEQRRFLSNAERGRINRELAHLTSDRKFGSTWDIDGFISKCCDLMMRFVDSVEEERAAALDAVRGEASKWSRRTAASAAWSTAPSTIAEPFGFDSWTIEFHGEVGDAKR